MIVSNLLSTSLGLLFKKKTKKPYYRISTMYICATMSNNKNQGLYSSWMEQVLI